MLMIKVELFFERFHYPPKLIYIIRPLIKIVKRINIMLQFLRGFGLFLTDYVGLLWNTTNRCIL